MRKVNRLDRDRRRKVKALNAELNLGEGDWDDPDHPLNRYDNGRLTRRGEEICYRLFDKGKSADGGRASDAHFPDCRSQAKEAMARIRRQEAAQC
ncbi:hypothetical protein [Mesorhizobium sp.]|uniref:hypothetical protein n=1 Tax=Mesorhizobium sp. TaxID=1871066 RepID=UPI000FEA1DD4|nr:hypothetical protein [Mesorhizobium sp.]RWK30800.1 MAG: hypothetical protein EOR46_31535 [Mesorhizobium sp.]RWK60838.1 MAG: hypothetical protein EOR54_33920 [Mesorhizobium sp.]RWK69594.1 MAG: hypothetical protein EOR50_34730 [Mesorhizobium sp.]RWK74061.1 MAG: hypothetical protein EOR51_34625 [Mesorhizobium sp.]RWK98668.1 MAG: hypothetical protein EOR55_34715 [Mesorhizobium sp.]